MEIEVYADGSATTKDKPGGYGYVVVVDGVKHSEGSDHMKSASNNDAELEGAIQGLAAVYKHILSLTPTATAAENGNTPAHFEYPQVTLVSDSKLILGWADDTYRFKQLEKLDRYRTLKALVARMNVKTRWVRGHSGDEHNERCDVLANEARAGIENKEKKKIALEKGESCIGAKKTGIMCVHYKGILKIIDFDQNIVEDYKREIHGPRGSMFEIREEKSR